MRKQELIIISSTSFSTNHSKLSHLHPPTSGNKTSPIQNHHNHQISRNEDHLRDYPLLPHVCFPTFHETNHLGPNPDHADPLTPQPQIASSSPPRQPSHAANRQLPVSPYAETGSSPSALLRAAPAAIDLFSMIPLDRARADNVAAYADRKS